jgi:glycosyltransferase involved in cell wall biosynthesis
LDLPKVSILIPTYNRQDFLKKAVESSLAQDYPNLEVIVSDNASTDATREVIEQFLTDKRFRYYRNGTNIGITNNWLKLMYDYPSGRYGKLLADDDYILNKSHISEAVNMLLKHDLDIVFSAATLRIERGAGQAPKYIKVSLPVRNGSVPRDWWLDNIGKRKGFIVGFGAFPNFVSGAVFNIAKARELKAFDSPDFGIDYELSLRFMLLGKAGYLRGDQYVERAHPRNDGTNASVEVVWTGMNVYQRIFELGMSANIETGKMVKLKRNSMVWFLKSFLVRKWIVQRGISPSSIHQLFIKIHELDPVVAFRTIFSGIMFKNIVKALISGLKIRNI